MATPELDARLVEVERQFVDLWGTMSSLWGIRLESPLKSEPTTLTFTPAPV